MKEGKLTSRVGGGYTFFANFLDMMVDKVNKIPIPVQAVVKEKGPEPIMAEESSNPIELPTLPKVEIYEFEDW